MYTVFIRNWYKWEWQRLPSGWQKKVKIPCPGRKTILTHCTSEDQARDICRVYNANHNPGVLSRKAEYTS